MTPLLFELEQGLPLFESLRQKLCAEAGLAVHRRFPDGETYLRIYNNVRGRDCILVANLAHPDEKFLSLAFFAATLRDLGATSVGLVAPYLSYMRQDCRFAEGEALTSKVFADLLSRQVDWLVTVDPHLHRYKRLDEIYSIPAVAVQGAPVLAEWLAAQQESLLLVGPDIESEQWVSAIARRIQQPFVVGTKERRGDRDVTVTLPDVSAYQGCTAVVVDDVIASGHTLLDTIAALKTANFARIDCAAVHGIFADNVDQALYRQGVHRLITSNSIPHPSNAVDLGELLVGPIQQLLQRDTGGE